MDNEYNYYQFDEQPEEPVQEPEDNKKQPKKGHKKIMKKAAVLVGCAVIFGAVGGAAFQGTNYMVGKILGTNNKQIATAQTSGSAKTTKLNQSTSTVASDVSEVVKNAMPSVVSITNLSVQEVQGFFGGVMPQESTSTGSGIIIGQNDTELLIVSNNHVVENASTLTVTFVDNNSVQAQIKGTDAEKDLAVISVALKDIPEETSKEIAVATLGDSSTLQVGEPVIAIGNALGYGQSVTTGIVSATERELGGENSDGTKNNSSVKYIQTDAAINPGNSGGALLNANGEVIGINSAKVSGEAVEGMGYAIPVSDVSDILTNLMNKTTRSKVDESERGYIGIFGLDVSNESSKLYNMPSGVFISEVTEGGAADKAGITKGSIITKFDGTSVTSMDVLQDLMQYYKAGETVEIVIQIPDKSGEYVEKTVEITLQEQAK